MKNLESLKEFYELNRDDLINLQGGTGGSGEALSSTTKDCYKKDGPGWNSVKKDPHQQ